MVCCATTTCLDLFGCPEDAQPDFIAKKNSTSPPFKIKVFDCDGTPFDLTGLTAKASMWSTAKFKAVVAASDVFFKFADNIGFHQLMIGDIVVVEDTLGEKMLILGVDKTNNNVLVKRGYDNTTAIAYKKGVSLKIVRFLDAVAAWEMDKEDQLQADGTTKSDVITESRLVYNWFNRDTCKPGCYWLEFKLISPAAKSEALVMGGQAKVSLGFDNLTFEVPACEETGVGIGWIRKFPPEKEGFLIKIIDSPTALDTPF